MNDKGEDGEPLTSSSPTFVVAPIAEAWRLCCAMNGQQQPESSKAERHAGWRNRACCLHSFALAKFQFRRRKSKVFLLAYEARRRCTAAAAPTNTGPELSSRGPA